MGITEQTPTNLVFRVGTVKVNGASLGATVGDATFRVRREVYAPELAGAAGPIKGTHYVMGETAELEVTLAEVQLTTLQKIIAGASLSSNASSEVLGSGDEIGPILDEEYIAVEYTGLAAGAGGGSYTIYLHNAIVVGDIEIGFADKGNATYRVTFQATYRPGAPTERPWVIKKVTA